MVIRKSKKNDKNIINELFLSCYGYNWNFISPLTDLEASGL